MRSAPASLLPLLILLGCGRPTAPPVELTLDDGEVRQLVPRTAWAEHLHVPGSRNELRIVLTDGDSTCERYVPPAGDELLLTVTIASATTAPIGPGVYAWSELPSVLAPNAIPPPIASPRVLIGDRTFQPLPGGGLELRRVEPPPQGSVTGLFGFVFPGDATAPATSIRGSFTARSCQMTTPER